jgi:catechol 2,3-dioxygenase-like lactoylglutathione lyase family enzyme
MHKDRIMIRSLDHLVITTNNMEACIDFYTGLLGMRLQTLGDGRKAVVFGEQKFNLHDSSTLTDAYAARPTHGSLDFCLLADGPLDEVIATLKSRGVTIELGPVMRTGARFPIRSIYLRDPDGKLVEIAEPA